MHAHHDVELAHIIHPIAIGADHHAAGINVTTGAVSEGRHRRAAPFDGCAIRSQAKPASLNPRIQCFLNQSDAIDAGILIAPGRLPRQEADASDFEVIASFNGQDAILRVSIPRKRQPGRTPLQQRWIGWVQAGR